MIKIVPKVVDEFGISQEKANTYGYFRHALEVRKYLNRKQKRIFDQQRVAFSRLASMRATPGKMLQNEVDELVATINSQ